MRKIDLIVITVRPRERTSPSLRLNWTGCTGSGDSTGAGIIITCGVTERSVPCVRWDRRAHMRKGITRTASALRMKGGLDAGGNPADTRTEEQKRSIRVLVRVLCEDYRIRKVVGHRDLSPDRDGDGVVEPEEWIKLCPCYDVESDLAEQKCRGRCRLFG